MAEEQKDETRRWTNKRRAALVQSNLEGETSTQEAVRKHWVTVAEMEDRKERYLLKAENALRARPKDEEPLREEQIMKLTGHGACEQWSRRVGAPGGCDRLP